MARGYTFHYLVEIEPENETNCGCCLFAESRDDGGYQCLIFGGELKQGLHSPKRLADCQAAAKAAREKATP